MGQKHGLSQLTRGILDAVQDAEAVSGQHILHMLKTYFVTEGEHTVPRYVQVKVPGPEGASPTVISVPLISLITPHSYFLEEMDVELVASLSTGEVKRCVDEAVDKHNLAKRMSYQIAMGAIQKDDPNKATMRMKFRAADPPEGLMKLLDEIANTITPTPLSEAPEVPIAAVTKTGRMVLHSHSSSSSSSSSSEDDEEIIIPFHDDLSESEALEPRDQVDDQESSSSDAD